MSGRSGLGKMVLALMLSGTMILTGCSNNWVSQAEQIVAVMIPAAANIVTLVAALQGRTVSSEDLAIIQSAGTQANADLQLVQSLIEAYNRADETAKAGILNRIQTAINAVQANLQALLPALHIKDAATQTKIAAVLGIVISEVQSLAAVVPIVQGSAGKSQGAVNAMLSLQKTKRNTGGDKIVSAPLSAAEFVKSYNATLTAKTGNPDLDRTAAGLQIHQHSAVARWASVGILQ